MNELVQRLSRGEHLVVVGGPVATLTEFQKRLEDIGYVFIKFSETRGGTDLAIHLDKTATDLQQANFEQATGTVHVEGTLTLNYIPVRCIADIELATLTGQGRLVIQENSVV